MINLRDNKTPKVGDIVTVKINYRDQCIFRNGKFRTIYQKTKIGKIIKIDNNIYLVYNEKEQWYEHCKIEQLKIL